MKKSVVYCVISWVVLVVLVVGLYNYASQIEVTMEPPAVQLIVENEGKLTLRWEPVDYATSYRVYCMNGADEWELLTAVSSKTNSYELPVGSTEEKTYAVCSCNVSMVKTTLSQYSKAVIGEG